MSKFKEQWESGECIDIERGCCDAYGYIKELEQQKSELIEALQKCLLSSDHYHLQECLAVLNKYKDGE